MRENRTYGSEGGEAKKPSLPLSLIVSAYDFVLATRSARGVAITFRPRRAWGMPDARCTRGLVCTWYW